MRAIIIGEKKMKKTLLTAILSLGACFQLSYAEDHTVNLISNDDAGMMYMQPSVLKIAPGDTVTFVPSDASHNAESVFTPDAADSFSTQLGKTETVTLNEEGVYIYKCAPHLPLGMVGIIQVGEANNLDQAKAEAEVIKASISMNKERIDSYLLEVN